MLQPLIDLLTYFWHLLVFWTLCHQYENVVLLRLGNYKKTLTSTNGLLGSGLHFIIPFGVDTQFEQNILPDTMDLTSQSLTTKDNKDVTVELVIKYIVTMPHDFILGITGRTAALSDLTAMAVVNIIMSNNYSDITNDITLYQEGIRCAINRHVEIYGIKVQGVSFKTFQKCRTIRLINDSSPMINIAPE